MQQWTCAAALCAVVAVACVHGFVTPYDGMKISKSMTFQPGTYVMKEGISIVADGVILDMNGAVLEGTGYRNQGVLIAKHANVTVMNGVLRSYFYGVVVQYAQDVTFYNMDCSNNYVDPDSRGKDPPGLDINCLPDLTDKTNLGGGFFLQNVSAASLSKCNASNNENGFDLFYVESSTLQYCTASSVTGWGVHLHASNDNFITNGQFNHCWRTNLGDAAGVLLAMGSCRNTVTNNEVTECAEGFLIGNQFGWPNNDNTVTHNNFSNAEDNAVIATFSVGNTFAWNDLSYSRVGIGLDYSHDGNIIQGNRLEGCHVGVQIDHGQRNIIIDNTFLSNHDDAIFLHTDLKDHFPATSFPNLGLPIDHTLSTGYTVERNHIESLGWCVHLMATTDSVVRDNLIGSSPANPWTCLADEDCTGTVFAYDPPQKGVNIVGGPYLGGNYWGNYDGTDTNGDGLGDTLVPYTNDGSMEVEGDTHPLIMTA
eukprot:TRINITY_DN17538_c0_g1_i1.p1 TRINITY_DN17538_c0_g1~~TRINITY_DN17538_c0_g1_i1.p1  ORF type:complete len:481 (-),score=119.20 TRINITY_DN17538_c0_g1_i1:59-1501(-)